MDAVKIGGLICRLRKEQGMTQAKLAEAIHVSSKAVSKWETGQGCPDISLLERLGQVLSVDVESLLSGSLDPNTLLGGNMKKKINDQCYGEVIQVMAREWLVKWES